MSNHTCFYFQGCRLRADGSELSWRFKAWRHDVASGHIVLWELLGVLDPLCVVEGMQLHPSKWLLKRVSKLRPFWESFGIAPGEAFIHSIK